MGTLRGDSWYPTLRKEREGWGTRSFVAEPDSLMLSYKFSIATAHRGNSSDALVRSMALASCLQHSYLYRCARFASGNLRLPFGLRFATDKVARITGH